MVQIEVRVLQEIHRAVLTRDASRYTDSEMLNGATKRESGECGASDVRIEDRARQDKCGSCSDHQARPATTGACGRPFSTRPITVLFLGLLYDMGEVASF